MKEIKKSKKKQGISVSRHKVCTSRKKWEKPTEEALTKQQGKGTRI